MTLPLPTSHLIVNQGDASHEVEVFRCETDGAVLFRTSGYDSSRLYQLHGGHKLKQPVVLKQLEIDEIMEELHFE